MNIKIIMKDGTIRDFPHKGRPGGSYTKRLRYEKGVAIVTDEWGGEIGIPLQEIKEIQTATETIP